MNKKFASMASIILCVLCMAVSFAWMIDVTAPTGHFPLIKFDNTIYIASNNIDVTVEIEDNNGNLTDLTNYDGDKLFAVNDIGPGTFVKYKLTITNRTDVEVSLAVVLSDFETSLAEFYDYVYIGVYSTSGFYYPYNPPELNEVNVKEAIHNNTVTFIQYTKIPNKKDQAVEIRFYVRVDHKAGNELMNQSLTIGKINFLTI